MREREREREEGTRGAIQDVLGGKGMRKGRKTGAEERGQGREEQE